jgi:type II secretory pathway pseudopilin PulG
MPKVRVTHSAQVMDTFQEIRFSADGGGPGGMEVIFHTSERGLEIKVWDPFKHQWITVNADAFREHGDTRNWEGPFRAGGPIDG